jgi:three-Cys-motif partner protein
MSKQETTLWPLGPHSPGKHIVLRRYLDAWLPILGGRGERILIIDGFAGPGRYAGGEDGSPIIALKALRDHPSRSRIQAEVVFLFIEKEKDRADWLRTAVAPILKELGPRVRADVIVGAFDETMLEALRLLDEQKQHFSPAFVMVDPFGVSDTPLSVIGRILQNPKSEVYVSFMWEFFNRFKDSTEFPPHLDQLFGCTDWQDASKISDTRQRKRFIFDLYKRQLKFAGAEHVVHFELYDGGSLVYAIFFATKHRLGCDKMKAAIWQIDPTSGVAFRSGEADSLSLFPGNRTRLKQELRQTFGGKPFFVDIEDLQQWVQSDATDHYSGQLKKTLAELEKSGDVEIEPGSRTSRAGTFPSGTRLRIKGL